MARKVSQISPNTLVKKVLEGKRKTVWIAGLKIDKYAGDETQYINTYFIKPQEVEIELGPESKWGNEYSSDRVNLLDVELPDGSIVEILTRWQGNTYGLKYFKDEEHAKKYFLVVTKNLYDATNKANEQYRLIHAEIAENAPSFIKELEY